jgi:DNA-binding CsgD family transcriptional regulator
MNEGWVSIYRQIFDNKDLKDNNHLLIFIYMVVHASHKPAIVTYRKKRITLKRGQLTVSSIDLCKRFNLSRQTVRTILKNLELTNSLTHTLHKQLSVYTIVNYDKFQDNDLSKVKEINQQTNQQNNKYYTNTTSIDKNMLSLSSMTNTPKKITIPTLQDLKTKIIEKPREKNEFEIMREKLDSEDYEKWVLRQLNS